MTGKLDLDLVRDGELCELLGRERKFTWRMRKRKENPLPYIRISKRIFYERALLERWILSHRVVLPKPPTSRAKGGIK